jgi:hypothetical protein
VSSLANGDRRIVGTVSRVPTGEFAHPAKAAKADLEVEIFKGKPLGALIESQPASSCAYDEQ